MHLCQDGLQDGTNAFATRRKSRNRPMPMLLNQISVLYEMYSYGVKKLKSFIFPMTNIQLIDDMKNEVSHIYDVAIDNLIRLGIGHEGVVFTDKVKAYKVFFNRLTNIEIFDKVLLMSKECELILPIMVIRGEHFDIISRQYLDSNSHVISAKELKEFLINCKEHQILFWDFKKENFIEFNGKGRLVDYGVSFEQYDETIFKQSCLKAFLMVNYPFIKPWLYKHIAKQIDKGIYAKEYFGLNINYYLEQDNFVELLFESKHYVQ
jgi:hypothetical protein